MSRTDDNLKIAFADESQTNIEYLEYAHRAIDEGLLLTTDIARRWLKFSAKPLVPRLCML